MKVLTDAIFAIFTQLSRIGFFDLVDIVIVSVIFYYIYKFVRDRRAGKLAVGILFVILAMVISKLLGMRVLSFLFDNIVQAGIIGVIILFQAELRSFLEKMGGQSFFVKSLKKENTHSKKSECIDAVVSATADLSAQKTGALIIFERSTKLGDVIKTGTIIDAYPSPAVIKNVFFNKAPLHDGALIIRNNRLYSAGCFLPLSMNPEIIKDLGTRHRAGIGMSENSDAVVIIVSEETGTVSIAVDGNLTRGYNAQSLREELVKLLVASDNEPKVQDEVVSLEIPQKEDEEL